MASGQTLTAVCSWEGLALTRHDSNSSCMRRVLWNEAHPEAALKRRGSSHGPEVQTLYTYSIAQ